MEFKDLEFTIISGAPKSSVDFIKENVDRDTFIIAADAGYLYCIKAGIKPDLIIGDFDSAKRPAFHCDIITLPQEKDDTDTFACVKEACKRGAQRIEIYAAIGSRLDHTLANIMCLEYCRERNVAAFIINEKNKAFIETSDFSILKNEKKYFSLFSLTENSEISISGAKYNIEHARLDFASSLGVSNEILDDAADIKIHSGKLLVILSND